MLFALLLAVLVIAAAIHVWNQRKLPPGPWGLPLVGSMPWMERARKERSFCRWADQYGPIFSVSEQGGTSVVLTDPEMIREAFSQQSTAARVPFAGPLEEIFLTKFGLIFSNGELWHKSRRFTLHHLRNMGMGRSKLEAVIQGQITQFMDEILAPSVGKPHDFVYSLKIAIANIIWGVASSENFSIRDERALSVIREFESFGDELIAILLTTLFPWAKHMPGKLTGLDKLEKKVDDMLNVLFRPAVADHELTVDLNNEPRDLIDALLQERAKDPALVSEKHILRSMLDLFGAGFDTTSCTLMFAFCLLAKNPSVQERLRQELHQVLGDRRATLADKPQLPYTEATLMEVQRLANVAPLGVDHMVTEPLQLGGYTLPRGTRLLPLLQHVHMNPKYFPNPEAFQPSRFLDANGKVQLDKALMPFGVGKRACLGEAMARAELFLFVTNILHRYRLRFPEGREHDLSVRETKMFIRELTPFELVLEDTPVTD